MKKFFLPVIACLAFFAVSCGASTGNVTAQPFSSQRIIEVPNYSQDDLYDKANLALSAMFKNAGSTLAYADKDSGLMQGTYTLSIVRSGPYYHKINVLVTVEVKEGKIRVIFTDLIGVYATDVQTAKYNQVDKALDLEATTTLAEGFKANLDMNAEIENFVATFIAKLGTVEW